MQATLHLKKEQQQLMPLFNGAFVENKPIPFPDRGKTTAYSNLFYWAHLVAYETSEFPLHPHEGFEIITFVFKGTLEHYDTATKEWTPLHAGGIQIIQAGSGVQHAERIIKGSELFQIWFDPDFNRSLTRDAKYVDYPSSTFNTDKEYGIEKLTYVGQNVPVDIFTEDIVVEKLTFDAGTFNYKLDAHSTYSYYLLNGCMRINETVVEKDDFIVYNGMKDVHFDVEESAELFIIQTPTTITYKRFIERYQGF